MKGFVILLNVASFFHITPTQGDVRLPPTIRRGPERSTIYHMYENVTLECRAEGTPAVRYEWKKNGFQLNANLVNSRKGSDGTITINRATEKDEGYYQCFAKNNYGTALSDMIHIRMAFIDSTANTSNVLQQTVLEGMPFHIQAYRPRSFPEPRNGWCKTADIDADETRLSPSKRMQFAQNGDLHFAYALPEDADDERIYRSYAYNPSLEVSAWGGSTHLTVTRDPTGNISEFAPTLAFSSAAQTVALIGGNVAFSCFFYGNPEPTISWLGPEGTILSGRYMMNMHRTVFALKNITSDDEEEYDCTASNTQGNNTQTFHLRVEAAPKFQNVMDGPYNVNVTEGETVTFDCNPYATPEAKIVWLQNGKPINADNPPERFVFSNDNRSLTIIGVCRDCVDRENKTDLMVIQCNASNVHGYAFAQGYVNVLMKTKVTISGPKNVSVDFLEEKQLFFQCHVTSDPSTPPTVRWYKTEPFDHLVRHEPPYVFVAMETLIIKINPKCSANCAKNLGEYKCVGDNGYTQESLTIILSYQHKTLPDSDKKEETLSVWKIILIAGAVGLVLFLIGICLFLRFKRASSGTYVSKQKVVKNRRLPNPPSIYEDAGYDSLGFHLEELAGNNERSGTTAHSMYQHLCHDSNDDQHQVHDYEAVACEPEPFPMSNEESASVNTKSCTGLNREETVKNLDLAKSNCNSQEVTSHSGLVSKEMNEYLDPKEWKENMDLSPREVNQNIGLDPKEVNQYFNPSPKDVNQNMDLGPKEVNQYFNPSPKDVNQNMDPGPKEENQNMDLGPKEVNQNMDLGPKEVNQNMDLDPKEVSQNRELGLN